MSKKLYEDFLVEHFCQWATKGFEGESRFQFRSPDSDNSLKLYHAMLNKADTSVELKTNDINQTLPAITFGKTTLIPVVHSESAQGLSENFISHLRDLVSAQDGPLKDCVLLVIHNSYLDTLINSARDIGKAGEVWHPSTIKKSLSELISSISGTDKVSQCLLDHRFKLIIEDGATMFGFTELYDALEDGVIQFSELGLFNDNTIVSWDDTDQIDKRLSQNHQLYGNISEIVEKYPQELVEKLGDLELSEKFVNTHFADGQNWEELDFGAIIKERRDNKENLLSFESEIVTDIDFIARENKKERHLIIQMPEGKTDFKIEASFVGGKIQKNELKLQHTKEEITLDVNNRSQKRSIAEISGTFNNQPLYFSVDFKREKPQERFKYRVLVIPQGAFYLDDLADSFLLVPRKQLITLQTNAGVLQIAAQGTPAKVTQSNQTFLVNQTQAVDFAQFANETDTLTFAVQSGSHVLNFEVDGAVSSDTLSLPLVLDTNLFNRLYSDNFNGLYNRAKEKVVIDGKDLNPKGMRKNLLNWEAKLQDERILATQAAGRPEVTLENIESAFPDLFVAYQSLFDYLDERKALISTCSWGGEFLGLANKVVECYLAQVDKLETKSLLSPQANMLVNIGITEFDDQEYITPLHPLTLAYFAQLVTRASDENDSSFNTLPKATIKRLNAEGLLPFVWHATDGFAYNQAVPENRMWCKLVSNKKAALEYVRPLVRQKTSEFTKAFDVLFDKGGKETVYINSINNGNNTALFLGLVDYLKKKSPDEANRIHVNIYDKALQRTYFDDFADAPSYDELKELAELGSEKDKADAIADMLKNRITYSKFKLNAQEPTFNYAHISFVRNDTTVEPVPVDVLTEKTGVACHGLLAGETAYQEQNTYFTTFGLNKLDVDSTATLKLSSQFNSLAKAAWCGQKYETSNGLGLKVAGQLSELLEGVYENSVWTVIIDPKVTLEFFKGQKDAVLIHYSDNFTNSANYDAITVTKRRDLYDQVLSQGIKGLIDEFNAFNGEWLLKMITSNDNDRKEKKSIIGAYKYVNCLLHQSDITWVPMSVAEMLRVAGNIGLKMSDSDFSRYSQNIKSGAISDDVLFVGFKGSNMYLLPLEVKIGKKRTHGKGIQQAKELKRYLVENLFGRDDLAGHLYRGLFIRQVLMQVDKFELYKVYENDYFNELQNNREWWLQGDYQVADLADYPQGFMMAFFENADFAKEEYTVEDDILQIILPSANLNRFISTPLQTLLSNIQSSELCYIPEQYILEGEAVNKSSVTPIKPVEKIDPDKPKPVDEVLPKVAEEAAPNIVAKPTSTDSLKVLVGHVMQNNEPVYWEPTNTAKFMNTNSGIIGTMGTGKTQCTKSVVTQLYRNQHNNVDGKPIGILIFDYKSDYVDDKFIDATNGKKFNLHKLPYNPLSLFGDTPMLPVHTARGFSETMGKAFNLGQRQQLKLRRIIGEAYDLAGIDRANKSTWSKPAPTMADIWSLFLDSEPAEDSLYAALESICELEIFEDDTSKCMSLYDLVDGITVVELAGYPGEIQNLVVALTLDLFYSQMQKQGKPEVQGDFRQVTKLVLVDEADNFMSQNFPSLRKILKEGREYGVGVILSTQDITHFKTSENDYSAYILSWIVHRVAQIKTQDIKGIFNKDDKSEQELLMKNIRELEKHTSLYIDGEKQIKRIKDKAFWELLDDA
ncbi:DNA phosphorothioation-dependent restriction protein DptH [Pseudoalteromonas sp. CST5]|uniref:DNA phosphorothioation-dependent restriction protein DptH n=1 Tax=unclassified Pseudoalteromonas TaxID=194690 RepID=UPI00235A0045|nr:MULTISPECIES: DNA phosphorothioation-dependent restriction protein DptH [unclassified Pseudoalteromonas]MDC9512477.1 DNA phosphorothioation-dependent restriction protein DptH [Pseudoalteromonas sp. CST1]MDC9536713.1 DNA phosphorothioation-dependent restriction protein DptH [Pseudoalteromonas sp. CST3]MDC9540753.1 DNA phosphorothioation-dependent restriction protein DptH [Pseudoalteromonas sp. CST2]MDC9545428.1 DNA phosphorothioation-dependent restriction protein DptH [Pseudoalteromonas sp. C